MCAVCAEFGGQSVGIWVEASSIGCFSAVIARVERRTAARSWCRIWIGIIVFLGVSTGGEEDLCITSFVGSNGDVLGIFLVSVRAHGNSIGARCKVFVRKHAVVVVVGGVALLVGEFACYIVVAVGHDGIACGIRKIYFGAIDRHVDIVACSTGVVGLVDLFVFGTNISHDISFGFRSIAIPCCNTAIVAQTLLATPFWAKCAVTSGLVGMEVTFYQITRNTMTKHTIVASITHAINRGRTRASILEGDVCIQAHISKAIVGMMLHALIMNIKTIWPCFFDSVDTTWRVVIACFAAIEVCRIVSCTTFRMGIGVYRNKIVCTRALCLCSHCR